MTINKLSRSASFLNAAYPEQSLVSLLFVMFFGREGGGGTRVGRCTWCIAIFIIF